MAISTRNKALVAVLVMLASLVLVGSASAKVKTQQPPPAAPSTTTVVENMNDVASITSSASSASKVTVLSYEMAKGLSQKVVQQAKAAGQCRWIGDGTDVPTYWNSGLASNGTRFWFLDHKYVYECGMRKVKCGNLLRFTAPKSHVVHGIVVLVKSFGKFSATVRASASAQASAWCGSAGASASAVGTVSGRNRLEARGNAKLLANVKATLSASAKASAQVHCGSQSTTTTTTTTPGTPTTPPVTPPLTPPPPVKPPPVTPPVTPPAPPTCSNVTTPENDQGGIEADGETYPGLVTVTAVNGHSLTISFAANLGSFATHSVTLVSSGVDSVGWLYRAPSDSSTVGQSDKVTVTVHDNVTGLDNVVDASHPPCSSGSFLISAAPGNPIES